MEMSRGVERCVLAWVNQGRDCKGQGIGCSSWGRNHIPLVCTVCGEYISTLFLMSFLGYNVLLTAGSGWGIAVAVIIGRRSRYSALLWTDPEE